MFDARNQNLIKHFWFGLNGLADDLIGSSVTDLAGHPLIDCFMGLFKNLLINSLINFRIGFGQGPVKIVRAEHSVIIKNDRFDSFHVNFQLLSLCNIIDINRGVNIFENMRPVDTIVIHHSVTDKYNKDIWAVSVEGHDYVPGYYIDGREYKGNYHFLVYWDGEVKNPVPIDRYTYHCGVYNVNLTSLAICFIGDYSTEVPENRALVSAKLQIEDIRRQFKIDNIFGHKELYATRCPGDWYSLNTIMEAEMSLTQQMIRKAYLAVLRREPDPSGMQYYSGLDISEAELYYQLAESAEHRQTWDDAQKYLAGDKYEEVSEKLYRKI